MADLIRDTALLGYVIGGVLVVLALAVLVIMVVKRQDDGFQPIGRVLPPPPRRSPFAPSSIETGRIDRIGLGE